MSTTTIAATATTPKIVLDHEQNFYSFEGEAYPEDVHAFFDPFMAPLKEHLVALQGATVTCEFFLTYFNSASTKVFFNFFDLLEKISEHNQIIVNWKFHNDDDTAEEFGKEFCEDLSSVHFNFIAV